MAKKKLESDGTDHRVFDAIAADIKNGRERNVARELFNKDWQETTSGTFEKQQGFAVKPAVKSKAVHKVKIFNPEVEKDKGLLTELMNSDKHKITYWKDNWTSLGEYRVFVVYTEIVTDTESK